MVVASAIISCHRSTQETFTLEDKYLRFITEKLEYELRNPIVADAYTNSGPSLTLPTKTEEKK